MFRIGISCLSNKVIVNVPAQLDLLARFDSHQIGPHLIWRETNWVKESQYGQDHKTIEQEQVLWLQWVNGSQLRFTL